MQKNEPSLEAKLHEWLETQGYPLEMRVARAFQSAGARAIQSDFYTDASTEESREIDVVASWQTIIENLLVRVSFVVECKSSREKPWILFVSPETRLTPTASVAQRAASELGRRTLVRVAKEASIQSLPIFRLPNAPGYSITQAFTSGHDICYAAASAVANAAAAKAGEIDVPTRGLRRVDNLQLVFPVVVTEARLFAAALKDDGAVSLKEQTSGVLLWRNPLVGLPHTIIHIVTLPALPDFIAQARETAEKFMALCASDFKKAIEDAKAIFQLKTAGIVPKQ